ncbi:MAG: metallophosphoesterase [Syntrophales bacterium]|jgi:putative phosphoesterase|nr:metallophosphoesterase [Syntrophales bacterium]MDY0043523.1 metallophosphoesterase [Syntrophales bacterium]
MKIGVISDTHLKIPDERLTRIIEEHFSAADLILHAGDLVELAVLDIFSGKDYFAVCGNMDSLEVKSRFPRKLVLEIEGCKIGLIHGWGNPSNLEYQVLKEFNEEIDCCVFGHTHRAENHMLNNILMFNPGSATDNRFSEVNSIGILETGKKITGTIIPFEKKRGR